MGLFKNALEKAQADLAATEAKLADLARQRDEAIDDIERLLAIDHQAELEQRRLLLLQQKQSLLENRRASEERDAAKARRAAAIKAVEAMLPERLKIVEEIETAIKALPQLFAKLDAWKAKFVKQYPVADVELPYAHFISTDRVLRHVMDALHAIRIQDASESISGLTDNERGHHADLIADLQNNPASTEDIAA